MRITTAAPSFDDHATGRTRPGVDAAEVREYVSGNPASRIDWAATARLGYPHVGEFEVTSAARTWLAVDAGPSIATGPEAGQRPTPAGRSRSRRWQPRGHAADPVGLTVRGGRLDRHR